MTRVAQPLNDDRMIHRLDNSMPRGLLATTQGLDNSMACGQTDGATARAKVFAEDSMIQWLVNDHLEALQPEVSASARNNAMDGCFNNVMIEKATMQIGR